MSLTLEGICAIALNPSHSCQSYAMNVVRRIRTLVTSDINPNEYLRERNGIVMEAELVIYCNLLLEKEFASEIAALWISTRTYDQTAREEYRTAKLENIVAQRTALEQDLGTRER